MPMSKPPAYIAAHVRRVLRDGGSAPHSIEVQRFFKEEIQSRGWYTKELRQVAARVRRSILRDEGLAFLVAVADHLFRGRVMEEKVFAVYMLQRSVADLQTGDFDLLESWLNRVSSWADHDALVSYLIAPMLLRMPEKISCVFVWAKSPKRWHRRAAAVALIRGAREQRFVVETECLTHELLGDPDDMVQKGLAWLLREFVKFNRSAAVPLLERIRERAPRLVLRTACETLPAEVRKRLLSRERSPAIAR